MCQEYSGDQCPMYSKQQVNTTAQFLINEKQKMKHVISPFSDGTRTEGSCPEAKHPSEGRSLKGKGITAHWPQQVV